jgi:group I intron endonuclease
MKIPDKIYYCYKATNSDNGKVYIGFATDPQKRWRQHKADALKGKGYAFHRAIRKHGWEAFQFEVICCGADKRAMLDHVEPALIEQYQSSVDKNGYNIFRHSTSNYEFSKADRQKMSRVVIGDKNPFFGKQHSKETRLLMSERKKGKPSWNKGKYGHHCSEETKHKMSAAQKRGNKMFPERNIKRAKKCRGKKHDPATILKMVKIRRQRGPISEETRQKMRAAKIGGKLSEITKEKMKISHQNRRLKETQCR